MAVVFFAGFQGRIGGWSSVLLDFEAELAVSSFCLISRPNRQFGLFVVFCPHSEPESVVLLSFSLNFEAESAVLSSFSLDFEAELAV